MGGPLGGRRVDKMQSGPQTSTKVTRTKFVHKNRGKSSLILQFNWFSGLVTSQFICVVSNNRAGYVIRMSNVNQKTSRGHPGTKGPREADGSILLI